MIMLDIIVALSVSLIAGSAFAAVLQLQDIAKHLAVLADIELVRRDAERKAGRS